jgi:hypothetical protein
MTVLTPSEIFIIYVKDLLQVELIRPGRTHLDALERRLWDAAQFDSYIIGRNSNPLLDELGLARDEALEYDQIIEAAKAEYVKGREGK